MRLGLPEAKIQHARDVATRIANKTREATTGLSSVGIERAVARILGFEGADKAGVPWANRWVDSLEEAGLLADGSLYTACRIASELQISLKDVPRFFSAGNLAVKSDRTREPIPVGPLAIEFQLLAQRILRGRMEREARIARNPSPPAPWIYVIVATGNIHEDVGQAVSAARCGADVIAVIRSTAQSLLDYVPEGLTTEGFGGTYATQENFRTMRSALDDVSDDLGRYVRLTNYASGLCMAEMAVLGSFERLDLMLSDSLYGILFRDINMVRTLVDQHFARSVQAVAGIMINTGEDNYLTTTDAFHSAHTVLASQFINQQFAHRSGLPDELIGLGHAFEMSPEQDNGLLLQVADALLSRTCFPGCPLKYMPPTRHKSGNIFQAHAMDALFALTTAISGHHIHLVGILTEAIHTPHVGDRALAIQSAKYVLHNARSAHNELEVPQDGLIDRRANEVLDKAIELLDHIEEVGLFAAIEEGAFAGIKRYQNKGRGGDGVFPTGPLYLDALRFIGGSDTDI